MEKPKIQRRLSWLPCHFGGLRPWFHCPARNCGRTYCDFIWRRNFRLPSLLPFGLSLSGENTGDRATRKADKIRDRLGWEPGILNGEGLKAKRNALEDIRKDYALHIMNWLPFSLHEATLRFGINMIDLYYLKQCDLLNQGK